jgi:hypothetical protein
MQAMTAKRSPHIWAVIVLTLALAVYFGWAVAESLLILAKAGATSAFSAYIPAAIIICVFLVAALAVYRGYRWSLFLYQLGVVLTGVQLLLLAPGLWQAVELLARSPVGWGQVQRNLLIAEVVPVIEFAIALYGAIVVYREIHTAPKPI